MRIMFIAIIMACCVVVSAAQDESPHVIDKALANCLMAAKGTMPRAGCYSKAFDAWEKDITKTYAQLLASVSRDKRSSLQAAQQAWIKFRDAEFDFITRRYAGTKGTGFIATRIILRTDVLKPRALQLEGALNQIKSSDDNDEK